MKHTYITNYIQRTLKQLVLPSLPAIRPIQSTCVGAVVDKGNIIMHYLHGPKQRIFRINQNV